MRQCGTLCLGGGEGDCAGGFLRAPRPSVGFPLGLGLGSDWASSFGFGGAPWDVVEGGWDADRVCTRGRGLTLMYPEYTTHQR